MADPWRITGGAPPPGAGCPDGWPEDAGIRTSDGTWAAALERVAISGSSRMVRCHPGQYGIPNG